MPLAGQLDRLLDDRERARARHRRVDLAHGLKTPLQPLMGDAGQARKAGRPALARSIETVVTTMRRLVDREPARARIQSDRGAAAADPAVIITRIAGVLQRIPAGGALIWSISAPRGLRARVDGGDLTEALGALMENAMRHAIRGIEITVTREDGDVVIGSATTAPAFPMPP